MSNLLSRILRLERKASTPNADALAVMCKTFPDGRRLFNVYEGTTRVAHAVPESALHRYANVLIDPNPDEND